MLQIGGSAEILAEHHHHLITVLWCNNAGAREVILVLQSTQSSPYGENKGQCDFHLQLSVESSACSLLILNVLAHLKLQNTLMEFLVKCPV
jgi:hypothetical protein